MRIDKRLALMEERMRRTEQGKLTVPFRFTFELHTVATGKRAPAVPARRCKVVGVQATLLTPGTTATEFVLYTAVDYNDDTTWSWVAATQPAKFTIPANNTSAWWGASSSYGRGARGDITGPTVQRTAAITIDVTAVGTSAAGLRVDIFARASKG